MILEERKEELYSLWLNEDAIEDPDDDWRNSLSREELALVDVWDEKYDSALYRICVDILRLEQRLPPRPGTCIRNTNF